MLCVKHMQNWTLIQIISLLNRRNNLLVTDLLDSIQEKQRPQMTINYKN